jgi:hypothetical protein
MPEILELDNFTAEATYDGTMEKFHYKKNLQYSLLIIVYNNRYSSVIHLVTFNSMVMNKSIHCINNGNSISRKR